MAATVLNDAQIDILNMMRWVKSDETLNDLKQAISDFFAKKAKEEMDAMWENGTMTQEKFDSFATLHERTPYRR
ncbi:MAG: dephospho-CoA kinase [Prevotella sp.]|nr:dephospho-CoA kinase [Prevotella sp.]MDY3965694.1 dephospho-CoA kinase [Prevotella sp.]